ncbi:hypothetical protein [Bacteroides sedimenti]|uniref:Uncharacterized protein n=1 Tax=Bacteroides sedimenti TaxID=2136147 RepID=A0ABM8IK17_9BACE
MRNKVKYLIISLIISILSAFFITGYLKVRNFAEAIANEDAARGHAVEKNYSCDTFLRKAKENLNTFYEKKDINYLRIAKIYLDSIDCDSFRYKMLIQKYLFFYYQRIIKKGLNIFHH